MPLREWTKRIVNELMFLSPFSHSLEQMATLAFSNSRNKGVFWAFHVGWELLGSRSSVRLMWVGSGSLCMPLCLVFPIVLKMGSVIRKTDLSEPWTNRIAGNTRNIGNAEIPKGRKCRNLQESAGDASEDGECLSWLTESSVTKGG